jgi:hypothetical protein
MASSLCTMWEKHSSLRGMLIHSSGPPYQLIPPPPLPTPLNLWPLTFSYLLANRSPVEDDGVGVITTLQAGGAD